MSANTDTANFGDAKQSAEDSVDGKFHDLFDDVEELLRRVSDVQSPEIQKIRAKARAALMMAKSAISDGATHVGRRARRAAGTTDDYLREYPWYALGAGTLLGFGLGLLVARSRD